jgi:hypothetical protein
MFWACDIFNVYQYATNDNKIYVGLKNVDVKKNQANL